MRKKILVYVSDNRGYTEVKNIVKELSQCDCDFVFIYPIGQELSFESNIDYGKYPSFESKSIGVELPFLPDILLITKESWLPETNLIIEFKQVGTIVCNLENSSWLYNNIKTRLEILSRMRFPTNMIDVFFDHSDWILETKTEAGWVKNKSVITGVSKFDSLQNISTEHIISKYNIDKPVIVLYGSMENNIRPNIIKISQEIEKQYRGTHCLFYKPHPKEFVDFSYDFNENHLVSSPSFRIIETEDELHSFAKLGDIHIGIIASIMYFPIYFNKSVFYIDADDSGVMWDLDFENFKGHEYNFWAPIVQVNSFEQFEEKIGKQRVENFKKRYGLFIDAFKNILKPYKNSVNLSQKFEYDNKTLLNFYDNFSDGNASKRIINYLLNIYN
jgi:hypothetical protein